MGPSAVAVATTGSVALGFTRVWSGRRRRPGRPPRRYGVRLPG
jgi:hypothetical protein